MDTPYTFKHIPEDFIVREQLDIAMTETGQYTYLELTKRDYAMLRVVGILARHFGIPEKHIGYAGTKDKKAVTTQLISLKLPRYVVEQRLSVFKYKDISLHLVGCGDAPISLGDHTGNWFTIVVRGIKQVPQPRERCINYFDEQRFQKNNADIGRHIIKQRFIEACALIDDARLQEYLKLHQNDCIGALRRLPKKLLMMYVHAYQSYLWNTAVALCVEQEFNKNVVKVPYSLGYFVFPKHDVATAGVSLLQCLPTTMPIIGFGMEEQSGSGIISSMMKEEGISHRDFILRELPDVSGEGGERDVLVCAEQMMIGALENDTLQEFSGKKKCTMSFFLQKAAYATMVLRQAFLF